MLKKEELDKLLEVNVDEDGLFIIDMMVMDDTNFISPYCSSKPIISNEVVSYYSNAIKNIPPKMPICLHIHSKVINADKEKKYADAIKNYYSNEYVQLCSDLARNLAVSIIMFVIGLIVTTSLIILASKNYIGEVWHSVFEIIAWVFIWEAADKFFFERNSLKRELRRAKQFINAKILFKYEEDTNE